MSFESVIAGVELKPNRIYLPEKTRHFLMQHGASTHLLSALEGAAYASHVQVGNLALASAREIPDWNLEDQNRPCVENGFIIIGNGSNGDPIAVEVVADKVAFVSHDLLWEEAYANFDECVVRTPWDIDEFWTRAVSDPNFPVDSYEMTEFLNAG